MKIINKDTLEISTDRAVLDEIKKTVSVGPNTLAERGWQPILAAPKPASSTNLKIVTSNGATQDANGNWVDAYIERDMFSDTVEDGVTTTKAEHETAHIAKLAAEVKQGLIDTAISEFIEEAAAMKSGYSQAEIDSWSTQEAEAIAWTLDNTAETPLLDAILSESGDTKLVLATTINGKAAALKVGVGKAIGKKQKKIKDAG